MGLTNGISIECVKWVSKNLTSFRIVEDEEFICMMKTGQPSYWIPNAKVANDVLTIFHCVKDCIAEMLQVSVNSFFQLV